MKVPINSDRACSPPQGFVTVYEFSLRARLQFLPPPELIDILMTCGVSLSQFFCRAMSIVMGLIMLFRDRGAVLSPEYLSQMGHLISDTKLKELPVPLHFGAEDLLKVLKLPDINALHYEVRYLSRYIDEEYLFKVGLSTQVGRSHAQMLKKSAKSLEAVP
ncbi:hypothetical protein IEQ34_016480 [Dendrobium chrysotoxum]|uniref:Uncharacterized protein n=1 Tax=Dendrobium chrysotoxum TaxID=161865 RepID=A0AAV7GDL6_DENCH|nr:hypothetical protein IEQ34_016480 [Dendrobium chrysotoxum]